jgi:hypothetical protein
MENHKYSTTELIVSFIIMPFEVYIIGLCISTLYGWFIAPVYNLPELGILNASGIAVLVSLFSKSNTPTKPVLDMLVGKFVKLGLAMLLGYLIHLFI